MLEIESVSWKNFMSYGDYVTTLNLASLGQCLITGSIVDDSTQTLHKSNGAGKSTIVSVIQWVLFGRTMHSHAPGNKIINYFTGNGCWAELQFKNGDKIVRTRDNSGHSEVIYIKNGDEHKLVSDTLGTSKLQQAQLAKEYGLDWEIFCGSVFFNQYGKPWMEMADQVRKKAIERILHVDKFSYRAKVAKTYYDSVDLNVQRVRAKIDEAERTIERLKNEKDRLERASEDFAENKQSRINRAMLDAKSEKEKRDSIVLPNLDDLKLRWENIKKLDAKVEVYRQKSVSLVKDINILKSGITNLNKQIQDWENKNGRVCTSCQQEILNDHIQSKIEPIKEEKASKAQELLKAINTHKKITEAIEIAEKSIEAKKPDLNVSEAMGIHRRREQHDAIFNNYKDLIKKISAETNPHVTSLAEVEKSIENNTKRIEEYTSKIEEINLQAKHYNYIYKAYNDRNKIKSYVFREHIPFINKRLRHYLEVFNLDIQIELTENLSISSNLWGYEFESGGERKRTDVAFMLAMFDFHEQMYGRQCNVLVLDEVDGRLDDDGIESLINIIKTDLASKVETILIVSHRNMMFDTFPKEIKVTREDRFSRLEIN